MADEYKALGVSEEDKAAAHAAAEKLRAEYRYAGGTGGSQPAGYTQPTGYTPYVMPRQNTAETYIRELYNAQQDAVLNALKSAYEQNVVTVNDAEKRLPEQYNAARNLVYGESEIQRGNFNEQAAASGMGSGAGTQARLSYDTALLGSLGSISREEADKKSDLLIEKTRLDTAYKNAIAEAKLKGSAALAEELYKDYTRVDGSSLAAAKAQADENYRAYTSKY